MQDLKELLETQPRKLWKKLVKKNPTWVEYLRGLFGFTECLNEQMYLLANDIAQRPLCPVNHCQNKVNWINGDHYGETCSYKCSNIYRKQTGKLVQIQNKMQQTMTSKYGVANPSQSPGVIERRKATLMQRYGALSSTKTIESSRARAAEMNQKSKQTLCNKYGVANSSQIPGVQDKKIKTLLKNHGVEHPSKIPSVQKSRLEKQINRYRDLSAGLASIISWDTADHSLREIYDNPNPRITFKCDQCGHLEELATETFRWRTSTAGTPCVKCAQLNKGSAQEKQLASFVRSLDNDIEENTRKIINPFEIDIWIPRARLAIEYCGLYWHSELRSQESGRHLRKLLACEQAGARLITIFEDEWLHRPHTVKSRIRNLLGVNERRLGARNLQCKSISKDIANQFCNEYHIQGVGKTKNAYGLFSENELVSVMTFSGLSAAKGSTAQQGKWELNRFCTKHNTSVAGGANRLFAAFVRDHMPSEVITYSDRRWNTGKVYETMGFDFVHHSRPNYWYIDFKSVTRKHRYSLRKNTNDNQQMTEWENRQAQGYNRIWDCGNSKWVWINKKAE